MGLNLGLDFGAIIVPPYVPPLEAFAPQLGLRAVSTAAVDRYRNAPGFVQGALQTYRDPADGKFKTITGFWDNSYKGHHAVGLTNGGSFTDYAGLVEPDVQDEDEHYCYAVAVDGAGRTWSVFGVHACPIRWNMLANGTYTPTSVNAQFNRARLGGDLTIPLFVGATNQNDATYPMFVPIMFGPAAGDLLLFFRQGSSGEGALNVLYLDYDQGPNGTWYNLTAPIVNATADAESVYPHHVGMHLSLVSGQYLLGLGFNWRRTGVATTTHDICIAYARLTPPSGGSPASMTWWKDPGCTVTQPLPVRLANVQKIETIAEDHGLFDLGDVTFDPATGYPVITKILCKNPSDTHVGTDTPHDTEYHYWEWNGSAYVRSKITALADTTTHYDSVAAGTLRETPACVIYNGRKHFYCNIEDGSGNVGMTRITTKNGIDIDYEQIIAPGGLGLGHNSACLDYGALQLSGNRYVGQVAQRNLGTPVNTTRYVHFEDLSLVPDPAPRLHLMGTMPAGAVAMFAFQGEYVVQSGGFVSRWRDLVLGGGRHANQSGADSLKPDYVTGPGGIPLLRSNGGTGGKYLTVTGYNPAAPGAGAAAHFYYAIGRKITHLTGSGIIVGNNSSALHLGYHSTSPNLACRNGNVSPTVTSNASDYVLISGVFAGSDAGNGRTDDEFRVGPNEITGQQFGTGDPSGLGIFAQSGGGSPTNWELYAAGLIIGGKFTDMATWRTNVKTSLETRYPGFTLQI